MNTPPPISEFRRDLQILQYACLAFSVLGFIMISRRVVFSPSSYVENLPLDIQPIGEILGFLAAGYFCILYYSRQKELEKSDIHKGSVKLVETQDTEDVHLYAHVRLENGISHKVRLHRWLNKVSLKSIFGAQTIVEEDPNGSILMAKGSNEVLAVRVSERWYLVA